MKERQRSAAEKAIDALKQAAERADSQKVAMNGVAR